MFLKVHIVSPFWSPTVYVILRQGNVTLQAPYNTRSIQFKVITNKRTEVSNLAIHGYLHF